MLVTAQSAAVCKCTCVVPAAAGLLAAPPLTAHHARSTSLPPSRAPCAPARLPRQALHKLGEPTALVRVRQADVAVAKDVMEPARKQYAATYGGEAPTLTLDSKSFLPPAPKGGDDGDESSSWCARARAGRLRAAAGQCQLCSCAPGSRC